MAKKASMDEMDKLDGMDGGQEAAPVDVSEDVEPEQPDSGAGEFAGVDPVREPEVAAEPEPVAQALPEVAPPWANYIPEGQKAPERVTNRPPADRPWANAW